MQVAIRKSTWDKCFRARYERVTAVDNINAPLKETERESLSKLSEKLQDVNFLVGHHAFLTKSFESYLTQKTVVIFNDEIRSRLQGSGRREALPLYKQLALFDRDCIAADVYSIAIES